MRGVLISFPVSGGLSMRLESRPSMHVHRFWKWRCRAATNASYHSLFQGCRASSGDKKLPEFVVVTKCRT